MEQIQNYALDVVKVHLVKDRTYYSNNPIHTPFDAIKLVKDKIEFSDREMLYAVYCNVKLIPINLHLLSVGNVASSVLDISNIFKCAILSNASCFMLIHNHPSGDDTPSYEDFEITENVRKIGELMKVKMLDHIIIGKDKFYSISHNTSYSYDELYEV